MSKPSDEEIEQLITDNMLLAHFMAHKFARTYNVDAEEAQSQALFGLTKAANSYEKEKGAFSSLAGPYITNALRRLTHPFQGKPLSRVDIDAPMAGDDDDGDASAHDVIPGREPEDVAHRDTLSLMQGEVATLPERERSILTRWVNGETYREIAADTGLSFVWVGKIVRTALDQLKSQMQKKDTTLEGLKTLMARSMVESLLENVNDTEINVGDNDEQWVDDEQWVYQRGSDYETWGLVIGKLKNGGYKVISFTSYNGSGRGHAKVASTANWHPAPQDISSDAVPDIVKEKIGRHRLKMP